MMIQGYRPNGMGNVIVDFSQAVWRNWADMLDMSPAAVEARARSVTDQTAYPFYCSWIGGEWLGGSRCQVKDGTIAQQAAISKAETEYVCRNLTGDAKETCLANAARMTARTQDQLLADRENLVARGDDSYCQAEAATKYPTLSKVLGPGTLCSMGGNPDGSIGDNLHVWITAGLIGVGVLLFAATRK